MAEGYLSAGELREELDAYGDHLLVTAVTNYGLDSEARYRVLDVDSTTHDGETVVVLELKRIRND